MPTWPGTLPQAYDDSGYRESPQQQTVRTPMDVGPDKVRKRSDAQPRLVSGTMRMTDAQLAAVDTFFTTTTSGGAVKFDFPYRTGTQEARFLSPPSYSYLAPDLWSVTLSLEVFV